MIDLKLTEDGDLVLGENGDLATVFGDEAILQEILFRLKTQRGDWTLSPNIGASLEEFIGEPNIEAVHRMIESRIINSITQGNLVFSPMVKAIPVGDNEVFILVEFNSSEVEGRVLQIQSGLDLRKGLVFSRSTFRE